jgi:hypothetical protein
VNPGPIGLGDVFRAIAALAPEERERWPAIANMLGFEMVTQDAVTSSDDQSDGAASAQAQQDSKIAVGPALARQESSLPVLEPLDDVVGEASSFLVGVENLPEESGELGAPLPPLLPLLAPATAPSILRATAAMPEPRGPLDLQELVRGISRRRLSARLPRRRRFAVARDVIVLLDLGEGMDVFAEDAEGLVDALRLVAGHDAVRLGGFMGRPIEALAELCPQRGSAIVVMTDLGLTPLAGPDERGSVRWIELADFTRRIGARATLLVPWPAERWPTDIAARLALATWDRSTSVAHVLRTVRSHG